MAKLGLWNPFIEREMLSWYHLSPEMAEEARHYRADGKELDPFSPPGYKAFRKRTIAFVRQSVAPFSPPYHNDKVHFEVTERLALTASDVQAEITGRKTPPLVRQTFGDAVRKHDAFHCASTLRVDAPRGMHLPKLGTNVTTEWVTAREVNAFSRRQGLPFPARLFQTGVIWASTSGGNSEKGRELGFPVPRPTTIWGAIMRAADVCPAETVEEQFARSMSLLFGEVPAFRPPRALQEFIAGERYFMSVVREEFDLLDEVSGTNLTYHPALGWRKRITNVLRALDKLAAGDRKLMALVHREAQRYGVRFE